MPDHDLQPDRFERDNATWPVGGAGEPEGRPPKAAPVEPTGQVRPDSSRPRRQRRGKRLTLDPKPKRPQYSGEQRLLILDVWRRSSLPAADFAPLVGVSMCSLYKWNKLFEEHGPAGLLESPKPGVRQSAHPKTGPQNVRAVRGGL